MVQPFADIRLGSSNVGGNGPAFIIAEAGVNHDGSIDRAMQLIDAAAEAGADAVKFQMFRAAELVTTAAPTAEYQREQTSHTSQREMLRNLELTTDEFGKLSEYARKCSLLFIATPFSVSDVARAVEVGTAAIKIASTDLTNVDLIEAATDATLPIILSTGASTESEIAAAVNQIRQAGASNRLVLLHCVSSYPTPLDSINLRAIRELRERFNVPVGLSDHTTSTRVGGWAIACGACVLEKHFTIDQALPGPDHAMSLNPQQLAEYIRQVREAESALGTGRIGMTDLEEEVRSVAARSVVSTVAIGKGTTINESMLALKRPGTGIPAGERVKVIGRRAKQPIAPDTQISWDMVE